MIESRDETLCEFAKEWRLEKEIKMLTTFPIFPYPCTKYFMCRSSAVNLDWDGASVLVPLNLSLLCGAGIDGRKPSLSKVCIPLLPSQYFLVHILTFPILLFLNPKGKTLFFISRLDFFILATQYLHAKGTCLMTLSPFPGKNTKKLIFAKYGL